MVDLTKGVGIKEIEGKIGQVIENKEVIHYPATQCLHDTDWSAIRVIVDAEPDSLWKKRLIRGTPDWIFGYSKVYIVLTQNPDDFEEGEQVNFRVLPTYYTAPRIATGVIVVKADETNLQPKTL
ncbi:hypothetical protein [Halorarum halobium]|uniref:hypothetical protein n=1 Tax=Halorarum halobium TaxID=3075121 RepID=UPI0028ACFC54|nr:hypothetical protein [Halobaculum sp. XH14]